MTLINRAAMFGISGSLFFLFNNMAQYDLVDNMHCLRDGQSIKIIETDTNEMFAEARVLKPHADGIKRSYNLTVNTPDGKIFTGHSVYAGPWGDYIEVDTEEDVCRAGNKHTAGGYEFEQVS